MEKLGDSRQVTGEVAFCPFRNSLSAPPDENILRKARVWILDFDKGKLYFTLRKFVDEIS